MLNRVLKQGSSGDDVLLLQNKLKEFGFSTETSGYFGQSTVVGVSSFQTSIGIKSTGEVNIQTWNRLTNFNKLVDDIPNKLINFTKNGLKIYDTLDSVDFYNEITKKNTIVISNSIGYDPNIVIKHWKGYYKSSDIILKKSSSYIIGGRYSKVNTWNGKIIKAFDDKYWSYSFYTDDLDISKIISIEICNDGPIVEKDNKYYNIFGGLVDKEDIVELDYLGYKYYHKYTNEQIESLRKLLSHLQLKHGIQVNRGIYNEDGFKSFYDINWFTDYNPELGGIKNIKSFIVDSFGLTPQKEILDMLNTI